MNLLADHLTREQLAAALGAISTRTIARYENGPEGLPHTLIGGRKYYNVDSVREWMKRREHRPNPRRRAA